MTDITSQLEAIHREVHKETNDSGAVISVQMERNYDSTIEDVWSALTEPDRVKRWLYPVTGDFRSAGRSSSKETRAERSWSANSHGCSN
jgi:uncharacterized protein YndB with AHSA1/START domain